MIKFNTKYFAGMSVRTIFMMLLALFVMAFIYAFSIYLGLALLTIWIHNILVAGPVWPYDWQHIMAWMGIYAIIYFTIGCFKKKVVVSPR